MRLVKLLKRPGQGIGVRLGSCERGLFVKQIRKNAPAHMDGELGPGVCLCGVCLCGVCLCSVCLCGVGVRSQGLGD